MTTTFLISVSNGLAVLPDSNYPEIEGIKTQCKHCSNPATHEYDGIGLCFSHWVAEERANE